MGDLMGFPENIVTIIKEEMKANKPDWTTIGRPLRPADPNQSLGIFALDWQPSEYEIGGTTEPTIARYGLSIQSLVKHASEEEGTSLHTGIAREVRTMLYRNTDLRVRLQQERIDFPDGTLERTLRYDVSVQRYRSNEISGQFVYLSVTDFWIETETV